MKKNPRKTTQTSIPKQYIEDLHNTIKKKLKRHQKKAFKYYAPICAYCGFGLIDVLEVAHIDGNKKNNDLENLAVLCPTCHRMLDVGIIKKTTVRKVRNRSNKADWSILMKDAVQKALAKKRREI